MKRHSLLIAVIFLSAAVYIAFCGLSVRDAKDELNKIDAQLKLIAKELRLYAKKHGEFPDNDSGLVSIVTKDNQSDEFATLCHERSTVAVSWREIHWFMTHRYLIDKKTNTLLDYFGSPIIYENRKGLGAKEFSSSPLNEKSSRSWLGIGLTPVDNQLWWEEVSSEVFVYSLSGRRLAVNISIFEAKLNVAGMLSILGLLALIVAICRLFSKDPAIRRSQGFKFIFAFFTGAMALIFGMVSTSTCYRSAPPVFPGNMVGLKKEQEQLIDDFVKNGVIKEATAKRLKEASERWD